LRAVVDDPATRREPCWARTYFINSQRDTVYYRPQTITASRRFARRPPLSDYEFTRRSVRTTPAPGLISDIVV
jgi:hypothetical protein